MMTLLNTILQDGKLYKLNCMEQAQTTKKREQFAISIRRKQVSQKLEAMRSQLHAETQTNLQKFYPYINQINNREISVEKCLKQLKILSFNAEAASIIFKAAIHHKLYSYLVESAEIIPASQYSDIMTILINLCVHVELDITSDVMQIVAASILKPEREMISLWLMANIIYQKSQFSGAMAKQLLQKCDGVDYMESRYMKKFVNEGDIVIFNFFCCSFLVVSVNFQPIFVKRILDVIEQILKYEPKCEENYWFLSEALVDHGPYIGASEYELFGTEIIKKFEYYCKNKKTKYVKNYLKMLIAFTAHDQLAYEKMLKYQIFKHLDFCLENRFPEIKKLCADIGCNLLQNFGEKVDIENIGFFQQLVLQILNIEKLTQDVQISITKYCTRFFAISGINKVTKQSKQKFINDILTTNIIPVTASCLINSNGNIELLDNIIHLITIFIKLDDSPNRRVIYRCRNQKMVQYLRHLAVGNGSMSMNNEGLSGNIQRFLQYFH